MEGVKILCSIQEFTSITSFLLTFIGSLIGASLCVLFIFLKDKEWKCSAVCFAVILVFGLFAFAIGTLGSREYIMAAVDSHVSIEELSNKYEVIEHNGDLWKLKPKSPDK
jgi:VIT1/CCC1 family predicted Fe2+/Mn2+ transporter